MESLHVDALVSLVELWHLALGYPCLCPLNGCPLSLLRLQHPHQAPWWCPWHRCPPHCLNTQSQNTALPPPFVCSNSLCRLWHCLGIMYLPAFSWMPISPPLVLTTHVGPWLHSSLFSSLPSPAYRGPPHHPGALVAVWTSPSPCLGSDTLNWVLTASSLHMHDLSAYLGSNNPYSASPPQYKDAPLTFYTELPLPPPMGTLSLLWALLSSPGHLPPALPHGQPPYTSCPPLMSFKFSFQLQNLMKLFQNKAQQFYSKNNSSNWLDFYEETWHNINSRPSYIHNYFLESCSILGCLSGDHGVWCGSFGKWKGIKKTGKKN